jgi:flagellar basal-body rod modification protein FlgD
MSTVSATNPLFSPVTSSPTAASAASAAGTASTSAAQTEQSQFLSLLVTQLKEQNPLDPQDGTQFVTQLAQFSSLEELVNIRTILQNNAPAATNNPNPTGTTASQDASTNSTQGA